jgi:hypothetical protein
VRSAPGGERLTACGRQLVASSERGPDLQTYLKSWQIGVDVDCAFFVIGISTVLEISEICLKKGW